MSQRSVAFVWHMLGYARVSTDEHDLALQRAALKVAGCRRTSEGKISGSRRDQPELCRMLDQLREDDVVGITRLDRFARSTRDLLEPRQRRSGLLPASSRATTPPSITAA